jgi:hypothetical protein
VASSQNASAQAGEPAKAAPEKPGRPVFLWSGIIGAAAGSLFFNLYHDTHLLPTLVIAIPAGVLPPYMTVVLGHAIKEIEGLLIKLAVFTVTIAAMAVSAIASAPSLVAAYGPVGAYILPISLDCADLILLFALIKHYERAREHARWLANQAARNQRPAQNQPAAPVSAAVVPALEPPAGTTGTARGAVVPGVVPGTTPGTTAVPVTPASATATPVPVAAVKPPRPAPRDETADAAREKIVAEIAARPENRPAGPESTTHRAARGDRILAEFRQRADAEMNLREFARAMGVSKATAGEIRRSIITPAAGERPAERAQGIA